MEEKDYYTLLEVGRDATFRQIKVAYRKKIRMYHPDLNKSTNALKIAKLINLAYATLSNPLKRKEYDLQSPDYTKGYTVPDEVWEDISNIYREAQKNQGDIKRNGKGWTTPINKIRKKKVRVQTSEGYYDIEWH